MGLTVSSSGDIGDCLYLLGILRDLPDSPHTLLLEPSTQTKAKGQEGVERLLSAIGPLASSQPYIKECRLAQSTDTIDWRSADFRSQHYTMGQTLMQAHLNHLIKTKGIGHGITGNEPWLTVIPSNKAQGRIVINRTGRYRNPFFRWSEVVKKYRHKLLFIGLHHEWREFCGHFGYVEYHPTSNMLEVAQVIAGCELFIGNQSCCNAIAEGLKKNMIQETSTVFPDCIWKRDNAQHIYDGSMTLPGFEGDSDTYVTAHDPESQLSNISTNLVPPGGWQYPGCGKSMSYDQLYLRSKGLPEFVGKSKDDIKRTILAYTLHRVPDWQQDDRKQFFRAEIALKNSEPTPEVTSKYHSLTGRTSL